MSFTSAKVRKISADIEKALAEVEKKHGVKISRGNARFSDDNFTLKLNVAQIGASGKAQTKERVAFQKFAGQYGLKKSDLDATFTQRGRTFKIVGLNIRAHKYPILAESNGKKFKFDPIVVKALLNN